eukprot:9079439-Pyramimonas_sp.AAC.1
MVQVSGSLWPFLHGHISAGTAPVRGRADARGRCAARRAPGFALLSTKDPQGDPRRRSMALKDTTHVDDHQLDVR